jgi:hypothetical protein
MVKNKLEQKVKSIEEILKCIDEIYYEVDNMNGAMVDLLEVIDKDSEEYIEMYDFFSIFPTYSDLDSIRRTLKGLKGD